jgi:hypothetical protein
MDKVRKKIIVDLFSAPSVLVPFYLGSTSLIVGWAMGIGLAVFAGLAGLVGAAGILTTRLIFGLDQIAKDAYDFQNTEKQKAEEMRLQVLERRLRNYERATRCVQDIRTLRQEFMRDLEEGKLSAGAHAATDKINAVLEACVRQLEIIAETAPPGGPLNPILKPTDRSKDASTRAKKVIGALKQHVSQTDKSVEEVEQTIAHTRRVVEEFKIYSHDKTKTNLSTLRGELDQALRVARSVDEKLSSLDEKRVYNQSEYPDS